MRESRSPPSLGKGSWKFASGSPHFFVYAIVPNMPIEPIMPIMPIVPITLAILRLPSLQPLTSFLLCRVVFRIKCLTFAFLFDSKI